MDFLLLLPHRVRLVLEVDGQQHYSANGKANPELYAQMVSEDRQLKLSGYEVYRFGGHELDQNAGPRVASESSSGVTTSRCRPRSITAEQ
ncbi:DUF559 domain-containing protein [Streptomyces sp. NPDC059766]|uniref:DUF559 domain-containing protein n=1 Tax=Streptomyces sp. NPDC059766 TaxID=3346940 RepID=UPI003664F734